MQPKASQSSAQRLAGLSPGSILDQVLPLAVLMGLALSSRAADWQLVWSDEFERDGLPDPTKWTQEEGFIRNRERHYYTVGRKENAQVGGCLIIEARKARFANARFRPDADESRWQQRPETADYTSASLTTEGRASWTYGRIEVRAKLPSGRGTWPAIWMLGTNRRQVGWPACGEIDILEYVGHQPAVVHATVRHPGRSIPNSIPGVFPMGARSRKWGTRRICTCFSVTFPA